MDEKNKLIDLLMKEKGGSREDYLNLINRIAYHETGGTFGTDTVAKKIKGHRTSSGAVGMLQYKKGKNEGGITAARRYKNLLKERNLPIPEWLEETVKSDHLDVRKLDKDKQEILFLADYRMHPKADYSKLWNKEQSIKDFWLENHWAGDSKYKQARGKSFERSMKDYEQNYLPKQKKLKPEVGVEGPVDNKGDAWLKPWQVKPVTGRVDEKTQKRIDRVNYLDAQNQKQQKDGNTNSGTNTADANELIRESGISKNHVTGKVDEKTQKRIDRVNYLDSQNQYAYGGAIKDNIPSQQNRRIDDRMIKRSPPSRNGSRPNSDGSNSTHIYGQSDNVAFPTLFQNEDGSWKEFEEENWRDAKAYAEEKGEAYEFKTEEEAKAYANGSWKIPLPELKYSNQYAMGGNIGIGHYDKTANTFGAGGTHEQNPIGGIPIGMGNNGKLDTVEEKEASFNFSDKQILMDNLYIKPGKTIFSNRLKFT